MKNFLVGLLGGVCGGLILMYLSSMGMVNTANKLDEQHIVMENDLTKNDEGFTTQQVDKVLEEGGGNGGGDTGGGNGGGDTGGGNGGGDTGGGNGGGDTGGGNGGGDTGGGNGGGDTGGDTGDGEEEATPRGPTGIECPDTTFFLAVRHPYEQTKLKENIGQGNGVFNPLDKSVIRHGCYLSQSMIDYNSDPNNKNKIYIDANGVKDGIGLRMKDILNSNSRDRIYLGTDFLYQYNTTYACRYKRFDHNHWFWGAVYNRRTCPIEVGTRPHGITATITKNGTNSIKYEGTFDGAYAFSKIECNLLIRRENGGNWIKYRNGKQYNGTTKGAGIKHSNEWTGLPKGSSYRVQCLVDNGNNQFRKEYESNIIRL